MSVNISTFGSNKGVASLHQCVKLLVYQTSEREFIP